MNFSFFKAIIFGFFGLFIFVTIISFFIPSEVDVVRNQIVHQVKIKEISKRVCNLQEWKKWHPIFSNDSINLLEESPKFIRLKKGKREITLTLQNAADSAALVQMNITDEPLFAQNIYWQTLNKNSDSTSSFNIVWHTTAHLKWYPWQKFYGIFLDKITAPGYEKALQELVNNLQGSQQ